jgi:hypothetical protein
LVRLVGVEFVHLKIKGDLMVVKAVDGTVKGTNW